MAEFNHFDLALLNPAFDSPLVDVLTELEHLRRLQLVEATLGAGKVQPHQAIEKIMQPVARRHLPGTVDKRLVGLPCRQRRLEHKRYGRRGLRTVQRLGAAVLARPGARQRKGLRGQWLTLYPPRGQPGRGPVDGD